MRLKISLTPRSSVRLWPFKARNWPRKLFDLHRKITGESSAKMNIANPNPNSAPLPYLLTYLLSHSRGTPLSHPHCPVGQLRSRVVGPEYVGHRWWGQGGGKVGRGRGGGYYYFTLPTVSLSASLSPHLFLSSSSWLPLACSPHSSTPAHPAFAAAVAPAPSNPPCARATGREPAISIERARSRR